MAFILEIKPNDPIGTMFSHLVSYFVYLVGWLVGCCWFFSGAFVHSAVKNCDISNFLKGKKAAVCFLEKIYMLDML